MLMEKVTEEEPKTENSFSPDEFELYLPWACRQLQLEYVVQVVKVYQNEYVSVALTDRSRKGKTRSKLGQSRIDVNTEHEKENKSASLITMPEIYDRHAARIIKVQAMYDVCENLVHIKFEKNNVLPRIMMKVIGLIIQFQKYLNTITIDCGLDKYTVHEISKFLPASHITDICLDDCYLQEPNYQLLLETVNFLKYLSLCRCRIDDSTVEVICSKLVYPLPASKTLSILNLSSNRITDEGAKFLADTLRSNRQLSYLNIASNMISDKGAAFIFETLIEFPLTADEVHTSKARNMTYLQNKNEMLTSTIRELRLGDQDKKSFKRKSIRPATTGLKKVKGDTSQKSLVETTKYLAEVDSALVEKATDIVESALGDFVDPFSISNTFIKYGVTYCKGNNSLCSLNFSYNNLSYMSLRKVLSVLLYQRLANRNPRGLLNVALEGNCLPVSCKELSHIDNILDLNLMTHPRKLSCYKKRVPPKSLPR